MTHNKNSQGVYEHAVLIILISFFLIISTVLFSDELLVLVTTVRAEFNAR